MAQIEHFSPRTMDLFQYWDWKLCFLKSILGKGDWPVAQKLKMFSSQWRILIGDPWVSSIIEQDLSLDLMSIPGKNPIESFHLQSDNHIAMSQEVLFMLEKRVIEICPEHEIGVVSPMFVVPKKNRKKKPVWDGRWINKHLPWIHFKMENLLHCKGDNKNRDSPAVNGGVLHKNMTHHKLSQSVRVDNKLGEIKATLLKKVILIKYAERIFNII